MIKGIKIQWKKTNLCGLPQYEDAWFYILSRGNALLYIGITYWQDVIKEVMQTLRAFDLNTSGLSIWLGCIIESDYGRITEQIIKDVEGLLVYTHQPIYNTQCKASFTGRGNLKVKNSGCRLLIPCVNVEGGGIYYTCR